MKKQLKIVLSDTAYKLLLEKSKERKETMSEVTESMIMEFAPSTPQEKKHSADMRVKFCNMFLENSADKTLKQAWSNGYLTGWREFQLRKTNSMFKKYKKYLRG